MADKISDFREIIKNHLGLITLESPVVRHVFEVYERPNLHFAIEELLSDSNHKLMGVVERDYQVNLARLTSDSSADDFEIGPVEYLDVELEHDERIVCVKKGLFLFENESSPYVILICRDSETYPPKIVVEVMAKTKLASQKMMAQLVKTTKYGKAFRGKVFSLQRDCHGAPEVKFHRIPQIQKEDIILPAKLIEQVERHTISFSKHADRLRKANRHIKRGILLHGPPGTGKTLLATYLASRMEGRTVLILTGAGMGSIESACNLARMFEPATVILEDVDLIGTQRNRQSVDANALLFELLNQMDGFSEDSDVLFILTTNRPDILEPALGSRPGRIDQAIEVPLPNADCRKRLMQFYAKGLKLEVKDLDKLVRQTEGVSAAFIREMLRKASVFAAIESHNDDEIVVTDSHLKDALSELAVAGGKLTKSLLGATELSLESQQLNP